MTPAPDPDDFELPGLAQLQATPEILRTLLSGIDEEQAQWKPSPSRWSIAEVLEHLSHVEGHCFRLRAELMVDEENPRIEPYDQEKYAAEGQYSGRDPEDSFDHFETQREANVEWLETLPPGALARTAMHEEYGAITLAHLMNEWAFHDLGHIRQIAELVRAQLYYPRMGPLATEYKISP